MAAKKQSKQSKSNPRAFKHQMGVETVRRLAAALKQAHSDFRDRRFISRVAKQIEPLELKQRIELVTDVMAEELPQDYPAALEIVTSTLGPELEGTDNVSKNMFFYWPHAHFVQTRGLEHFDESLEAMVEITKRATSELAVRPFIHRDAARVIRFLKPLVKHPNPHVRRWVSEGTRPRLPWGMRLTAFVEDPKPGLALLEKLRSDPSLYVRKSVANHLGDIAKDHPDLVVATVKRWLDQDAPHARWIAEQGLRHPIKAGHAGALSVVGVSKQTKTKLSRLKLDKKRVGVGDQLGFSFLLHGAADEQLVVDYAVEFQLARGKTGRKVYKLKKTSIGKGQELAIEKRHSFRPITTRTYYPGKHAVEILVNGRSLSRAEFTLVV